MEYNAEHGIVPKSAKRAINESAYVFRAGKAVPTAFAAKPSSADEAREAIEEMTREMLEAADRLEFERAAYLRDQIAELKGGAGGGNKRKPARAAKARRAARRQS